jgi:putative transposase
MERPRYPSDLTDRQWQIIAPMIPAAKPGGRPRRVDMREVINAILYLVRSGCAWRMLPADFPPWSTVHGYYRRFRLAGVWQQIHDSLREHVRREAGRDATPSAAIIDSQSVKTTEKGGCAVTTPARKSMAANDISLSTPSA